MITTVTDASPAGADANDDARILRKLQRLRMGNSPLRFGFEAENPHFCKIDFQMVCSWSMVIQLDDLCIEFLF